MEIVIETSGDRLDKFISENTSYSRSLVERLLSNGDILVNDNKVKSGYKLKVGDTIYINDDYKFDIFIEPIKMDLNIVYEDNYLIVVNKDSGVVVHPGSGNKTNTLVNGLLYHTNLSKGSDDLRPGIVHRIDKDTSGLLIVAKNDEVHQILANMFKNKDIKREYVALVDGVIPTHRGKINAPIGKSKQDFRKQEVLETGKAAVTNFEVIKRYKKNTLIKLLLETGRTHQIRVHMEYIGFPLHNDPVYNERPSNEFGQFLHSETVTFIHPITKEKMHFTAPLPSHFENYINELD